ncbi:hypothetical protein SETIT_1G082600v2 [Setaria italica]|uniref:Uncharacterized protein n=1 Tax=Setaria italica TaxID=4555 RepID=A0A368PI30_SETIT|nr:receptor-like protein 2 [Setaria italica]RCV05415.1 hypothetical protein SETIT_1G082600v2 [Setaria italica]
MAAPSIALATVLLLSLASPATSCSEQEMSSLLQFLAGLSGHNGLSASWRNGTDCCKWEGITCSADGMVIEIFLASRGLEGSISPSLADLSNLQRLNLSYNSFSGGLPSELLTSNIIVLLDVSFNQLSRVLQQNLSSSVPDHRSLQVLNISSNLFTGEFPSILWENKSNLVVLNASNNSFQGWMPSSFCISSTSFAELDLSYNQFSGSIPSGLGKCSALRVLKAGHNNLNRTLPDELFNVSSLEYLSFPDNGLRGILDGAHMMNLRNLAILDLGGNMLHGKIPNSIGQLKRLEELHLENNNMTGELPSTLSNCTNIITIDLKGNNFSGELQKVNFSNLSNLEVLDLLYNNFTGTIPESIYSCSNLIALRLSGNNLHGQLSPRIGNLKSLVFLSLGDNKFTNITNTLQILKNCRNLTSLLIGANFKGEAMPEDEKFGGFQNLRALSISECSLSGKIPLWLSKLKNLEMLFLQRNQLTGPIPAWIKNLTSLFHLDLSYNNLSGEIPIALMEMPMLTTEIAAIHSVFELPVYLGHSLQYRIISTFPKTLDLGHNNFTGAIPHEIIQLKLLAKLNFSFNALSGEIPQQLGNLTNLQILDLSSNHLTGAIPLALNNLHFLSKFNVSHNDLEGPIPSVGQLSTFPSSSFDGNPKLCGTMVARLCGSDEAPPVSVPSTEQSIKRMAFVIAFLTFFGVGVLYDQIVLSRYFG